MAEHSAHPTTSTTDSGSDVRRRILETASRLFYAKSVRAVGVDLIAEEAQVAKTSLYRYFPTKDDLVAAFLDLEDKDFWGHWDQVAQRHFKSPQAELDAHLAWIGERVARANYRGCPQINVAAEFPELDHPARRVATAHKRELRQRLRGIAERLKVRRVDELAGQLTLLVNGAFVSSQALAEGEAVPLLQATARALVAAAGKG